MKLKETQLLYLVIKLMKPFVVRDEKLRELLVSYFFVLIITLMLSKIFTEALSLSDKRNHKTFICIFVTLHRKHFKSFIWEVS